MTDRRPDLKFDLAFAEGGETAAECTRGRLVLRLSHRTIWDLDWTWIELLEHLGASWQYLLWEQSCPLPVDPYNFEKMRADAREYLQSNPSDADEAEFEAFLSAHDLSHALQGAWPRTVWLMRSGEHLLVWTPAIQRSLAADAVFRELERVGDAIAARLASCADPRAEIARDVWARRAEADDVRRISIQTGLPTDLVVASAGGDAVAAFWGSGAGDNELRAAARMVGGAAGTPEAVREIVQIIRAIPRVATAALDALSAEAEKQVHDEPHRAGVAVAGWLRARLGLGRSRVDPEQLLASWGVRIQSITAHSSLDAICCWGPSHGPAVLVNSDGVHAKDRHGRRTTLAHEIAHLLLDRHGSLPLGEVFGGRTPAPVEQRARAFAAELLLPQDVAAERVAHGGAVKAVVTQLVSEFDVSREVVAWQIRNSRSL